MSIPQGHEAVTPPDAMAHLRAWAEGIESMTTVVVCHPDDAPRIQAAVDRTEFPGLFRVVPRSVVDQGTMLVFDNAKLWSGPASA